MRLILAALLVAMLAPSTQAADAPPPMAKSSPSHSASSLQDGPADNLNRYMLKIMDQCTGIADAAQRAACCKHLIDNVCVADEARK